MPKTEWITIPDAAWLLRRSYSQTWRLMLIGRVPGRRIGAGWELDRETVLELVREQQGRSDLQGAE